jgi:hypothetical protein
MSLAWEGTMKNTLDDETIQLLRARVRKTLSFIGEGEQSEYDVFISYRQAESKEIASVISQGLRKGRHPTTGKSLRVFHDLDTIDIGQNIDVVLQGALKSSRCFIVLLTPTYSKSEYTSFEQMLITGEDWGGLKERIIPIMVDSCEVPNRLKSIRYLDLTVGKKEQPRRAHDALIKTYCLEFPQRVVATHIAKHLGASGEDVTFTFSEETGDINPDRSAVFTKNGTKLSFSWDDVDAAMESAINETTGTLIADGFVVTDRVCKGWRERWGEDEGLGPDSPIMVYLEKLTGDLSKCDDSDLSHALTRYGYDLPEDFDRSFLNGLPSPSPSVDVIHEMINREAWEKFKFAICDLANSHSGIAVQWCVPVVRRANEIEDASMKEDLERSRPEDSDSVRPWAEYLLKEWLGAQSIGQAKWYLAKEPTKENRRKAIGVLRGVLEHFPNTRAAEQAKMVLKELGEEEGPVRRRKKARAKTTEKTLTKTKTRNKSASKIAKRRR